MLRADDVYHGCDSVFGAKDFTGFYGKNLQTAIEKGKRAYSDFDHFFISILQRNDPLKTGRMFLMFIPRCTCPDPHPNHIVYKYTHAGEHLELLWVLPDPTMINNYYMCTPDLQDKRFMGLYTFCNRYADGDLQKLADVQNKFELK